MTIEDDVDQIGTSLSGKDTLKFLVDDLKWFSFQFSAIKFAITVAIKNELPPAKGATLTTSHNVSSLDPDQSLKNVILDLYPSQPPYKTAQLLADAGLEFMAERIRKDNWTIENFIA